MQLITQTSRISKATLKELAPRLFGNLVKAVVDINQKIMIIDAELHADEEAELMKQGSEQKFLWGINLYPDLDFPGFIEFDSMINLRPSQGNTSRSVDNIETQKKIISVVKDLVK